MKIFQILLICYKIILFSCLIFFFSNLIIKINSNKFIYNNINDIPDVQAVLVPGAAVYRNGKLSHVLEDRVLTAIKLYRNGKVKKFILSGDSGNEVYDEVKAMKMYLLKKGINEEDIFLDHAGIETYDSVYRAKSIFCVENMIIATQEFHINRSVFIGRMLGIETYGYPADRRSYLKINWFKTRDKLAGIKAVFKTLLKPDPKYTGDKIPITSYKKKDFDNME